MRVEFDLYCMETWSLWFDLKIVLLTPFFGLGRAQHVLSAPCGNIFRPSRQQSGDPPFRVG